MIRNVEVKTILSPLKKSDPYFGIAYRMNLYRGCQHGCIYCDRRSACYCMYESDCITVKRNAPERLKSELFSRQKQKGTIGTGSMNDPYMPVESRLQLTRRALQIIAESHFPVHIITKSDRVTRDSDLIRSISSTYAAVSFTITTADDRLARKIEPSAPATSARFKALEQLARLGIYTGVTLMPLLPYINDTTENLRELLQRAKECGASYVIPMFGVTLRRGTREYYYRALDSVFPGIRLRYERSFGEQYDCMSPAYRQLSETFYTLCDRFSLPARMRFYVPPVERRFSRL